MPIVLSPPGERMPLTARLAALGKFRKTVAGAAGLFALIGTLAAALLAACSLDAWLHLSPLARGFALTGTLVLAGIIWFRSIRPAFRLRTDPLSVALDLEDRFPRLNDSLGSAISFLSDESAADRGISHRLCRAAVHRAERMAERHDFATLVPSGRCWLAFWFCAVMLSAAVVLGFWNPARSITALQRFADPFGLHPWPTKTRIEILVPQPLPARLPRGDAFDLKFAVRGVIPEKASVQFLIGDGEEIEELLAIAQSKDGEATPEVETRFDPVRLSQSFRFRIRANDADTGWQSVEVLPPPRLVPLDGRPSPQLHAVPPAYTNLPPLDLPDGASVVSVPRGTLLAFRAAADRPLASAVLAYEVGASKDEIASAIEPFGNAGKHYVAGASIPLTVSDDGRVMSANFAPTLSGIYALHMIDETGLHGTRLLDINLASDPAPAVTLSRPSIDRDPTLYVPTAKLAVELTVADPVYAMRNVFLEYRVGRDGKTRSIAVPDGVAAALGAHTRLHPLYRDASFLLPIATFRRDDGTPVADGDTVFLRAAAADWDNITVKEPGRSNEFELHIASRETVEAILQKELADLRPELLRAREQQRDAMEKTEESRPRSGNLSPADRERLLAAEYAQRQVHGQVSDPRDGLRAKAERLRELARVNDLPRSHATDRAAAAAEELARLSDRDLAAIEPLLGDARQLAAQPPRPPMDNPVPGMLSRAARHQRAVEESLTNLIDLLSQWGDAGALRGDARLLKDSVRGEEERVGRLPEKVPPGQAAESLPMEQRQDLDRAAGKLDQLADRANGLLGRAAKLAADKEKQAADAKSEARKKEVEADELRKKAAAAPSGTRERNDNEAKAAKAQEEAVELKAAAQRASTEAAALRKAVEAAGGQALPDDLREAAKALRANQQGDSAAKDREAAERLQRFSEALNEKADDAVPELGKKRKLANKLDDLAAGQDDLRRRTEQASRIKDEAERVQELKRLAAEQNKLAEETRELVQKLQRDRNDDAARDARKALDKMEAARDDLERGMNPANDQQDATEKLDGARDRLDKAEANAPQELSDEKRRKIADLVRALYERQKAAVAEVDRLQEKVLADKKWSRELQQSYKDLEDREQALGVEVRTLAEREFAELLVFERIVKDAAGAIEKAAEKAKIRRQDAVDADPDAAFDPDLEKANAGRVRRPMTLALRRLEQVLEVLKPENAPKKKDEKKAGKPPDEMPMPMPMAAPDNGDIIPPLAQLKALRALQAECNAATAEFAKRHPDAEKLTDDDREELKELEDSQREIAALFEQMAKLFQKKDGAP